MRRCQVLGRDQRWRDHDYGEMIAGQVFRLFEEDGTPVLDESGCRRWRVLAPSCLIDGEVVVDAEPIPETEVERETADQGHWWPGGFASHRPPGRLRG